jgi:thymidylate synthase
LATQFPLVAEQLRANPASRRALLYIGQPGDGREEEKPCVSLLQFLGRRGRLDMVATIRSWDAISGFVYDTMVMGAIVQAMAEVLGLEPGTVYANAGSLHVYEADLARVPVNDAQKSFSLRLNGRLEWEDVAEWARVQLVNFSLWGAYPPEGIEVK